MGTVLLFVTTAILSLIKPFEERYSTVVFLIITVNIPLINPFVKHSGAVVLLIVTAKLPVLKPFEEGCHRFPSYDCKLAFDKPI